MMKKSPLCWICGAIADSGEHMIKQSDLKQIFPDTSQKHPIYSKSNDVQNTKGIGTTKSDRFHFSTKICKKCNGSLTHSYDEAWSQLSQYIKDNWEEISTTEKIDFLKVFGKTYKKDIILVQLYFGKIFATKLLSSDVKLPTVFSEALLAGLEIEYFYINFRYSNRQSNYAVSSDVEVYKDKEHVVYIQHFCTIGGITIDMIYSEDVEYLDLDGALKPSQFTDIFLLNTVQYNQSYIPSLHCRE